MVFVEGEGDLLSIQHLLGRLCQDTGGYYARGITVIEAGGIGRITRLVELAKHFGVRAFVLADRDGLRASDGRKLLTVLASGHLPPTDEQVQQLRQLADRPSPDYATALRNHRALNEQLAGYDAFIMCSDLEGLLLDSYGVGRTLELLGPSGEDVLSQDYIDQLANDPDAYGSLRSRLGSKGWEADQRPSQKLEPHVPALFLERALDAGGTTPRELRRLMEWLEQVVASTDRTGV